MGEHPLVHESYTFDPFARHPFYTDINRSLVRRTLERLDTARPKGETVRIVELAAGTGAVTQLILDELERLERPAHVTAIEPSGEAIAVARKALLGRDVRFVQGDAHHLAQIGPEAEAVFFCNAIHLVPDKADVLTKIVRLLRTGGLFACNSAFYVGSQTPESERFAHLWIRRALGWTRQHHPEVRASRRNHVATITWYSADEYASLLETHDLRLVDRELQVVNLPVRAIQDIGRYWLFIEGALPGIPIPIGAEALEWAAAEAGRELNMTTVPRVWLQLVAQRAEAALEPALAARRAHTTPIAP